MRLIQLRSTLLYLSVSVFTFLNISKVQAGKPTKSPVVISMDPRKWNILYSVGMPRNPRATSSTSWIFDFPDISQGEIDYITQNVSGAIVGSNLIAELQITTQGNTVFDYKTESGNTCDFPAHVRFYIQRAWTNNNYDRWWANPIAFKLEAASAVLSVPLDPSQWTDTWGHRGSDDAASIAGFKKALYEVTQIGLTFGGGCFFGHGVRVVGGTADFQVTQFRIE